MIAKSTPKLQRKCTPLNNYSFVDDIAQECNVVHRVGKVCEKYKTIWINMVVQCKILRRVCSSHWLF